MHTRWSLLSPSLAPALVPTVLHIHSIHTSTMGYYNQPAAKVRFDSKGGKEKEVEEEVGVNAPCHAQA